MRQINQYRIHTSLQPPFLTNGRFQRPVHAHNYRDTWDEPGDTAREEMEAARHSNEGQNTAQSKAVGGPKERNIRMNKEAGGYYANVWKVVTGHQRRGRSDHRPFPGVVARRGVPGGFRGVGGGTPVNLRSAMPAVASATRWTSRTARRAASPTCVCGRSASILERARNRSCGSVAGGRGREGRIYDESAEGSGWVDGRAGWERVEREMLRSAKRRSRSASDTRVVCNAELAKVCSRSTCAQ